MISIFALIYASTEYADSLMRSLAHTTPELQNGQAEFFFLANNATYRVRKHLDRRHFGHYVRAEQNHPYANVPDDIFRSEKYDYMIDVYRGWNAAIEHAKGDIIVPVNSDHVFCDGWLTELRNVWTAGKAVSPVMFEPGSGPKKNVFRWNETDAVCKNFGRSPESFDIDMFNAECDKAACGNITRGGVFMPVMVLKQAVIDMGMFRPGNITLNRGIWRASGYPADMRLFEQLKGAGIEHVTCWSSFCYHFQEGEMRQCRSPTSAR